MLEHLVRYAQTHNLETRAGYLPKRVRWGLVFDSSGRFLDLIELGDTSLRRNPGEEYVCPNFTQSEIVHLGDGCRNLLVDSVDIVVLLAEQPLDPKQLAKLEAKHGYFVGLLRGASRVIPGLAAIADSLSDSVSLAAIRSQLTGARARPTDKVTVTLLGREPPWIVESDEWHEWWSEERLRLLATLSASGHGSRKGGSIPRHVSRRVTLALRFQPTPRLPDSPTLVDWRWGMH
jgi:hypothetical protein